MVGHGMSPRRRSRARRWIDMVMIDARVRAPPPPHGDGGTIDVSVCRICGVISRPGTGLAR